MTQEQINSKRGTSNRVKPHFATSREVMMLTIFDDRKKLRNARYNGSIQIIRVDGHVRYNLNNIDPIYLKNLSIQGKV